MAGNANGFHNSGLLANGERRKGVNRETGKQGDREINKEVTNAPRTTHHAPPTINPLLWFPPEVGYDWGMDTTFDIAVIGNGMIGAAASRY